MDVEKTIEFLLQNQAAHEAAHDARMARIESAVEALADKTNRLDEVMATLAESHIKLVERMDTMAQRMDTMAQQSIERDNRLGERIDSFVSAMGEFIRSRPAGG